MATVSAATRQLGKKQYVAAACAMLAIVALAAGVEVWRSVGAGGTDRIVSRPLAPGAAGTTTQSADALTPAVLSHPVHVAPTTADNAASAAPPLEPWLTNAMTARHPEP